MNKIVEHYYKVSAKKNITSRIVLISDIHYYNKNDCFKLDLISDHIISLKPNYIAIAGDLLDEAYVKDLACIYDWILTLSKCAPVVISLGNHDLLVEDNKYTEFNKHFFEQLNSISNVCVLDNEDFVDGNISFKGITLPASYYYEKREPAYELITHLNSTFNKVDDNKFNILLCHTPLRLTKKRVLEKISINKQLDLILCGHTHGGITPEFLKPILKGIGIISPLRRLFFKNAYGHKIYGNTNIIISSGITKAGHRNMFNRLDPMFAREITVTDVHN